jgi:hypothetical protein
MTNSNLQIHRIQTGVRIEKRILKVLKAFAEFHDLSLGDLLEGIVLHAFDGKTPFSAASLARIQELKKFYGLDLDSRASHHLIEVPSHAAPAPAAKKANAALTAQKTAQKAAQKAAGKTTPKKKAARS